MPGKFHGERSQLGSSPWEHRVGHDRSYLARTHPPVDNSPVAVLLFAFYFIDFNLVYFLLFIQLKINSYLIKYNDLVGDNLKSIAIDLVDYYRFIEHEGLHELYFPKIINKRITKSRFK